MIPLSGVFGVSGRPHGGPELQVLTIYTPNCGDKLSVTDFVRVCPVSKRSCQVVQFAQLLFFFFASPSRSLGLCMLLLAVAFIMYAGGCMRLFFLSPIVRFKNAYGRSPSYGPVCASKPPGFV